MNSLITLIDSLTIFPLWADIIFLLLAVAIGIAILKLAIGIVIFTITALVGFVMLVVGGAFLLIASIIEKMDD
jgi:hypothetical protein